MFRLKKEYENSCSSAFVTLTYSPDTLPLSDCNVPTLCKTDLQLFMKRLRKSIVNPIRFFAIGEYGTKTHRPHYHLLLFGCPPNIAEHIDKTWQKGLYSIGEVSGASINYVTKYVVMGGVDPVFNDLLDKYHCVRPFMVCSKRPFIGSAFLNNSLEKYCLDHNTVTVIDNGIPTNLPRIYRGKIFNKESLETIGEELRSIASDLASQHFDDYEAKYGTEDACRIIWQESEDYVRKVSKNFKCNRKV